MDLWFGCGFGRGCSTCFDMRVGFGFGCFRSWKDVVVVVLRSVGSGEYVVEILCAESENRGKKMELVSFE